MSSCFWYLCSRNQTTYDRSKRHLTHIPKDILRFEKNLLDANLQHNQLSTLDKALFRCKKIERLYLNDNHIQEVPEEIGELIRLQELYLARNDLTSLPDTIRICERLIYLDLSSNTLEHIPDIVSQLRSLQVLLLNEVSLIQIPSSISSLCNLRVLEARDNLISSLPESISFLSRLVRLDLGWNEISSLPETIGQLECLTELWLDTNILSQLPQELGELKQLEILELSDNPLQHLPDTICNLGALTDLTITSSPLTELPLCIGNLKELRTLKIDFNQIKTLPDSICELTNLEDFYLSGNFLTKLPEEFGKLKALRTLHLDYNMLVSLPDSLCQCSKLSILSLRDNTIEFLPSNIGNLAKLTVLDLSGNKLNFLPFSTTKLKMIKAIWLSKTQQKSLYPMQTEEDTNHGKILTNFLLPQASAKVAGNSLVGLSECELQKTQPGQHKETEQYTPLNSEFVTPIAVSNASIEGQVYLIDKLCALNSDSVDPDVTSEKRSLADHDDNTDGIHISSLENKKVYNFTKETIKLTRQEPDDESGIEMATLDTNFPSFDLDSSKFTISDIKTSPGFKGYPRLRIGDRVLEIDGVSVVQLELEDAQKLLWSNKNALTLSVRHEPPQSELKRVALRREKPNDKLGLGLKNLCSKTTGSPNLLTIFQIDSSIPQVTAELMKDDIILETNGQFMFGKSPEEFKQLIEHQLEINLVIYRKISELGDKTSSL